MRLTRESIILLVIGGMDLASTILLIRFHGAAEANPLFQRYWEMGVVPFIIAKTALLVGPLVLLEWAKTWRPVFVASAQRATIAAYLLMYAVGVAHLNSHGGGDRELAAITPSEALGRRIAILRAAPAMMSERRAGCFRRHTSD